MRRIWSLLKSSNMVFIHTAWVTEQQTTEKPPESWVKVKMLKIRKKWFCRNWEQDSLTNKHLPSPPNVVFTVNKVTVVDFVNLFDDVELRPGLLHSFFCAKEHKNFFKFMWPYYARKIAPTAHGISIGGLFRQTNSLAAAYYTYSSL